MLKKPGLEELVRELERDYARWEQVYMAGSKDPFWPDGVNANLCRNHILCGKRRIRELYPDAEMPEIYYRPLPQELPAEYMARKEELRSAALRSYTRYISDENFCFIRNHVERIASSSAPRGKSWRMHSLSPIQWMGSTACCRESRTAPHRRTK